MLVGQRRADGVARGGRGGAGRRTARPRAPRVRYQIAPEDLLRIQREARERGPRHRRLLPQPSRPSRAARRRRTAASPPRACPTASSTSWCGVERRRARRRLGLGVPRRAAGLRGGAARRRRASDRAGGGRDAVKVQIPAPLRPLTGGAGGGGGRGRRRRRPHRGPGGAATRGSASGCSTPPATCAATCASSSTTRTCAPCRTRARRSSPGTRVAIVPAIAGGGGDPEGNVLQIYF